MDSFVYSRHYQRMSATKPALLRAFAESSASSYDSGIQRPNTRKRKLCKSTKTLRKVHEAHVKASPELKTSFASSCLYVVQPIRANFPLCLYFNAKFCKENKLENNTLVDLTVHGGIDKHWIVEFVYYEHAHYKRKAIMHNGFQEFVEDNDFKEGDQLVFHLMPCTLGNTTRPWLQVFITELELLPCNQAIDQATDNALFSKKSKIIKQERLPPPPHIVINSLEDPVTKKGKFPIVRSYKLLFNGKVVRHFFTLEYSN